MGPIFIQALSGAFGDGDFRTFLVKQKIIFGFLPLLDWIG